MLRLCTIVLFSFCCLYDVGAQQIWQSEYSSFRKDKLSPRELALQLTEGRPTDYDKVNSIFSWITENISYRSHQMSRRNASPMPVEEDTSRSLKPLNERVAEIVLHNRLAVCDGYARLFKTLCDFAGIRSEIINGLVRNGGRTYGKFQTNHSWNAVMIDGKWYLLDATWASGYVNFTGQFIRQYDPNYFLADPATMLHTHYPENPYWTLLEKQWLPNEFKNRPFKYFAWHRVYIDQFFPASGIIDVIPGIPVTISLETKEPKQDMILTAYPFYTPFLVKNAWQRNYKVEGQKISGTWLPGTDRPEWLYVVLNGEVIMRYSLRYN